MTAKTVPPPTVPAITLGMMGIAEHDAVAAIHQAIALGYRSFDTASLYGNEVAIGEALRSASVDRSELSVTTKLWNASHGHDAALAAFDRSMERLGLDYIDLYLIHWPLPMRGLAVETWKALVRLKQEGRVRAIGVSNFLPEYLRPIIDASGVIPAVNQIESHPSFPQEGLHRHNRRLGISTQAWSPLGNGADLADPVIAGIARNHARTPAQVILRWHRQRGVHPVAKAKGLRHMRENVQIDDFELLPAELDALGQLNGGESCYSVDPRTFVAQEGMENYCP